MCRRPVKSVSATGCPRAGLRHRRTRRLPPAEDELLTSPLERSRRCGPRIEGIPVGVLSARDAAYEAMKTVALTRAYLKTSKLPDVYARII
jgi:hypothetical protein